MRRTASAYPCNRCWQRRASRPSRPSRGSAQSEVRVSGVSAAARAALETARRAAFVSAGLRLAMEDLAAALGNEGERELPRMRIAILDRDLGGLGPLAAELEAGGVDVRVANYAEELGILLKTPAGREVAIAICDVMAFRPEQNVPALLNGWERDRPGLVFYLSCGGDSAVELERARRVPTALVAGQLARPLVAARLLEAVDAVFRRMAKQ